MARAGFPAGRGITMSFLTAFFYDRVMAKTEAACLRQWRRELLAQVNGEVLEIGAGTGANITLYSERVSRLTLTEPDRHMRRQLEEKIANHDPQRLGVSEGNAENIVAPQRLGVSEGNAENIVAEDESFDYVVTSLVCCSVNDLDASLREVKRVLKPGGGLVFLEHVAAPEGTSRRRWQNRINPIWKTFMGNCHLNRETENAIIEQGFEITRIERESMCNAPPIVRPTIRGIAIKPRPPR
jgi:ubiquinone/menaquinone biosynthesis C-methylase UbiE